MMKYALMMTIKRCGCLRNEDELLKRSQCLLISPFLTTNSGEAFNNDVP